MERTTISLPGELLQRLRIVAAERGVSMAALIREAVEEKLDAHRPRPRSLGIGASRPGGPGASSTGTGNPGTGSRGSGNPGAGGAPAQGAATHPEPPWR